MAMKVGASSSLHEGMEHQAAVRERRKRENSRPTPTDRLNNKPHIADKVEERLKETPQMRKATTIRAEGRTQPKVRRNEDTVSISAEARRLAAR